MIKSPPPRGSIKIDNVEMTINDINTCFTAY